MTSQHQYNNVLSQMLVLFDEAIFRYLTNKQVDADKFVGNFKRMIRRMTNIEQKYGFLEKKKLSYKIQKLSMLFDPHPTPSPKKGHTPFKTTNTSHSMQIRNHSPSTSKTPNKNISFELRSEKHKGQPGHISKESSKKREEPQKFVIDFENGRPKSCFSQSIQIDRQNQIRKRNNSAFNTIGNSNECPQNPNQIELAFLKSMQLRKNQRNQIYDQFDSNSHSVLVEDKIKLPSKKKINSHRWSYKINQYI